MAGVTCYSLGCMVYEMLAGSAPFTGPTAQAIISKRFMEAAPSLRATRAAVPEAVDTAVTRSLARVPADRFATAAQFGHALLLHSGSTPPGSAATTITPQAAKSIAVLPFADMSPQKDQDYFCEGIAEEIINALSKIDALQVASRTSTFAFKGKSEDVGEIGKKLKVATVLEGSVRKAANKLRVTAQLVNVANGYQLWSGRYDRDLEDVFAIQDEIAENIVKALRVVLSEDEKRALEKPTANVQAYDYYLRGRQFLHQFRRTGTQFARRMFERAMEIDPNYAIAYAGASDCCSFLYMYWDGSRANLEGADSYSKKALELAPEVAEAHASRGLAVSLSKRYEEAEREFETAIRLNPKLFEAHYLFGRALFQQGKYAEAVKEYQEASRVRPEDYQTVLLVVTSLRSLGRLEEADAALRNGIRMTEKHVELNPDDVRALYLGAGALIQVGERAKALEWARRAVGLDPEDSAVLYNVACVYALGGQTDDAFGCLGKAVQNGFGHRAWLENDSDFDSIRADSRFAALLEKL